MMKLFGGIEGGASNSVCIVCNETGHDVATVNGPGTNHWLVGIPEAAKRISEMVNQAKKIVGVSLDTKLTSMGLSLSGCEQEATNRELETYLRNNYPNITDVYVVTSDTDGSISTASPKGGVVVISGTGSNTMLKNPDGKTFNCGGWGSFLGDDGSAFSISWNAIKKTFMDQDNYCKSKYNTQRVWEVIKKHFNVQSRTDMLPHFYANFDKKHFAHLCKSLVPLAQSGDKFAKSLFSECGNQIALTIDAVLPKVNRALLDGGALKIVCVGSVFNSWDLLREGFDAAFQKKPPGFDLKLIRITKPISIGAVYMGADAAKFPFPRKYEDNYDVLYLFSAKNSIKANGSVDEVDCDCAE